MRISVKTCNGKAFTLEVKSSDAIENIHINLSDDNIQKEVTPRPTAHLHGAFTGEQLFVKTIDGKTIVVDIEMTDTVADLKAKIQDKEGIPAHDQKLFWCGLELKNSNQALYEYNILPQSTVHLLSGPRTGWHIFVKAIDKTMIVDVVPEDTVADVKAKIEDKCGIPIDDQRLFSRGSKLQDDSATLEDCHIWRESTIHLLRRLRNGR